ncbi:MAG: hypothetical protein WA906_03280 [Pacificimonas sp.]
MSALSREEATLRQKLVRGDVEPAAATGRAGHLRRYLLGGAAGVNSRDADTSDPHLTNRETPSYKLRPRGCQGRIFEDMATSSLSEARARLDAALSRLETLGNRPSATDEGATQKLQAERDLLALKHRRLLEESEAVSSRLDDLIGNAEANA